MKKHRQQMQPGEIAALESFIHSISPVLDGHTFQRMCEKNIAVVDIENIFKHGAAVEIHNEAEELRAVVRYDAGKGKKATGVVAVIGLQSGKIITAWRNDGGDNHSTLRITAYQWRVNVAELLQATA